MAYWNKNDSEYVRYLRDLAQRESTNNQYEVNTYGYLGLYQMGEAALQDAGLYKGDSYSGGYQNFIGGWTGKYGVWSVKDFLNNRDAQTSAVYDYHQKTMDYISAALDHPVSYYVGKNIGGVKITMSGMLAGAHLKGAGGLAKFLDDGINVADAYGTKISEYIGKFSGYNIGSGGGGGGSSRYDDHKIGNNGANTIHGYGGNDKIEGKGGNDKLYGDNGNDFVSGQEGHDRVYGGAGNDDLYGGSGNDRVYGQSGNDRLNGWTGNDRLYGGSGNDKLFGGDGNDYLRDDSGADYFHGGSGYDTVSYYGWYGSAKANTKTLVVDLSTGKNNSADTYASIENLVGSNKQKDVFTGTNGANTLNGYGGNDHLSGRGGNDKIYGGSGNDFVSGQEGHDKVYGGTGNDRVYGGSGNDYLYGHSGNDQLHGWTGRDYLNGGSGNDYIDGADGNDRMRGGSGADTFRFAPGSDRDVIYDFNEDQRGEVINISGHRSITSKWDLFNNHMSQSGKNVVIDAKGGDFLTLVNVKMSDLDYGDFIV